MTSSEDLANDVAAKKPGDTRHDRPAARQRQRRLRTQDGHGHARHTAQLGAEPEHARRRRPRRRPLTRSPPRRSLPLRALPSEHIADQVKICGITDLHDAELAVELGAWAIGMVFYEASPRRCSIEQALRITQRRCAAGWSCAACSSTRRSRSSHATTEELGLTMLQLHGDEGPAFCAEARTAHGRARDQGDPDRRRRGRARAGALPRRLSSRRRARRVRRAKRELRGGTGETFDWTLLAAAALATPLILSGGLQPGERRRGDRPWRTLRGGHAPAAPSALPGTRTRPSCERSFDAVRRTRADPSRRSRRERRRERHGTVEHRFGRYGGQYVPETLMPALAELEQAWVAGARGPRLSRRAGAAAARLRRAPDAAVSRGQAVGARRARACISSARISTTRARTSSTTRSARRCWPSGWASGGSSPRRAPASTGWRRRRCARCWISSASSTWAPRTRAGSSPNVQRMRPAGGDRRAGRRRREDAEGGDLGRDPRLGRERAATPTT